MFMEKSPLLIGSMSFGIFTANASFEESLKQWIRSQNICTWFQKKTSRKEVLQRESAILKLEEVATMTPLQTFKLS